MKNGCWKHKKERCYWFTGEDRFGIFYRFEEQDQEDHIIEESTAIY